MRIFKNTLPTFLHMQEEGK